MISIDRDAGYLYISRCDYLYRDGLENRDEKANREMGDGDICIPLPRHMIDRSHDHRGDTDGQNAETIINEIILRISGPKNTYSRSSAVDYWASNTNVSSSAAHAYKDGKAICGSPLQATQQRWATPGCIGCKKCRKIWDALPVGPSENRGGVSRHDER